MQTQFEGVGRVQRVEQWFQRRRSFFINRCNAVWKVMCCDSSVFKALQRQSSTAEGYRGDGVCGVSRTRPSLTRSVANNRIDCKYRRWVSLVWRPPASVWVEGGAVIFRSHLHVCNGLKWSEWYEHVNPEKMFDTSPEARLNMCVCASRSVTKRAFF